MRFALPSEALRPYVTTYYLIEARNSSSEPVIEDYLHPEWSNLRFLKAGWSASAIGDAPLRESPAFAVTGPTTQATRFRIGENSGRGPGPVEGGNWGIGLMPLGWAKLIGVPAHEYADRYVDGNADPAFKAFRSLGKALSLRFQGKQGDFTREVEAIEACLSDFLDQPVRHEEQITAINIALVDPDIASANQLAERVGMNLRSLERLSRRAFGFPPKLLLRRQRFLRSLSQFMLDPSLKWLNTLDW